MTAFSDKVAALTGVADVSRLAGGDLSEVLLVERPGGRRSVAKNGAAVATEAAMLRALVGSGVPAPAVEGEHDGVLMIEHVDNDRIFSPLAWVDIGAALRRLHTPTEESYGWPVDYRIGTVELDNRRGTEWPAFWIGQRLLPTAAILDRPWRERVEAAALRIAKLLPSAPAASLLHGDLWSGNILVRDGRLAALIDPACYYGHAEVDLAMLSLFDAPPEAFWETYDVLEEGWDMRRAAYQLFPALVHLRLFGARYGGTVDRLLAALSV